MCFILERLHNVKGVFTVPGALSVSIPSVWMTFLSQNSCCSSEKCCMYLALDASAAAARLWAEYTVSCLL